MENPYPFDLKWEMSIRLAKTFCIERPREDGDLHRVAA
jgi:hypothetical protein